MRVRNRSRPLLGQPPKTGLRARADPYPGRGSRPKPNRFPRMGPHPRNAGMRCWRSGL